MLARQIVWVTASRSGRGSTFPGPYVPTKGYPTSASDLFRVVGCKTTGHEGWNSAYTDVATCKGLSAVIEGEVRGWADIEAAEAALQVLLWHDRVDVIIPGFLNGAGESFQYVRCDEDRSQLCFDLFKPLQPFDAIFAVEQTESENGIVLSSTIEQSPLVSRSIQDAASKYLEVSKIQARAMSSIPLHMGVPAYFSSPYLMRLHDNKGHFGQFYNSLRKNWDSAGSALPAFEMSVHLPPLLAIVLDRASGRESIPEAITELRDELTAVRQELLALNEMSSSMMSRSFNQVDIEERCTDVRESFEAAFKASRYRGDGPVLPILKLYRDMKNPLDTIIKFLNPNYRSNDPRVIADRTITGRMFSELLVTDSMQSLLSSFFTESEVRSLVVSKPR